MESSLAKNEGGSQRDKMFIEDISEEVTFEQRPKRGEEELCGYLWEEHSRQRQQHVQRPQGINSGALLFGEWTETGCKRIDASWVHTSRAPDIPFLVTVLREILCQEQRKMCKDCSQWQCL